MLFNEFLYVKSTNDIASTEPTYLLIKLRISKAKFIKLAFLETLLFKKVISFWDSQIHKRKNQRELSGLTFNIF